MRHEMREELLAIAPPWVKRLPVDPVRGYPIPWFTPMVDGKPEFRAADSRKFAQAIRRCLCWVCGEPLGRYRAFVIGPMCSINRIAGDPPSHRDCAEFSVRACPFLLNPQMERRGGPGRPTGNAFGGVMLEHNPGVMLTWITRDYQIIDDGMGGRLFSLGDPDSVRWWREGRPATLAEALAGVARGFPKLEALCDGPEDRAELERARIKAERYLPAEDLEHAGRT